MFLFAFEYSTLKFIAGQTCLCYSIPTGAAFWSSLASINTAVKILVGGKRGSGWILYGGD